jgi:integrase
MPLTLVPPRQGYSPFWRIRGTVRGIPVNESTKTSNKALAEALRIKREAACLEESVLGPRVSRTFYAAAVEYIEAVEPGRSQRDAILGAERADGSLSPALVSDFGDMLCARIDQAAVDRVIKKRFAGRSPATVQRSLLTPLKAVLNYAARKRWCDAPSFERPKGQASRGRTRWLDEAEADRLLTSASPHLYRLVLFLLLSGARIGEALALEWDDVDLAGGWCVLRNTKRGKRGHIAGEDRGVPLHRQLVVMLANAPRKKGEARVFLSSLGEPYAERLGGGHIKTAWRLTCQRAGIADLRVHDLRHTFATWMLVARVPDRIREEIMGHRSSSMSGRYAHVPQADAIAAVQLLATRAKSVQQARPYPGKREQSQEVA